MAAAKNRAIDRIRREKRLERKHEELGHEIEAGRDRAVPDLDEAIDERRRRRPPPPDVPRLPPCPSHRIPGGAHAEAPRGIEDRRDRPRLPPARGDHRAAHRARQSAPSARRASRSKSRAHGARGAAQLGARGDLPRVQRGLFGHKRGTTGISISAARRGPRFLRRELREDARPRRSASSQSAGASSRPPLWPNSLVEHEVDHLEHRVEPRLALRAARDFERDARLAEGALGAHDALRDGRLGWRKARAISSVFNPPRSLSVSATRDSVGRTGWQARNIRRRRSSPTSSSIASSRSGTARSRPASISWPSSRAFAPGASRGGSGRSRGSSPRP